MAPMDLQVGRYLIPAAELEWSFGPSGGPGGQHANRSNTRAELRFDLAASEAFPEEEKTWMLPRLSSRLVGEGTVVVSVDESRLQWRNRSLARRRLAELLEEAMRRPTSRRPTRPSRAARERRREEKRARSERKRLRKPPEPE